MERRISPNYSAFLIRNSKHIETDGVRNIQFDRGDDKT